VNPTHQALRAATGAAHDAVDAAFGAFDLTDRASYARFLAAHAELVWPLEAALPGKRVVADWPERKRGALLKEDRAFFPPLAPRQSVALPDFGSVEAVAGTLYVLEGSRLGGKFLARGLPRGFPRAYLDADQRAGSWQHLLSALDGLLGAPAALDAAITAAHATFAAFERSALIWREAEVGE
jgi:heme oxygenase (biliverdin-IX-beta and delta-forming)